MSLKAFGPTYNILSPVISFRFAHPLKALGSISITLFKSILSIQLFKKAYDDIFVVLSGTTKFKSLLPSGYRYNDV